MDAYTVGLFAGTVVVVALIAWLIIRSIIKTVKYNIIKKNEGEDAAQEFWNAKKSRK